MSLQSIYNETTEIKVESFSFNLGGLTKTLHQCLGIKAGLYAVPLLTQAHEELNGLAQ